LLEPHLRLHIHYLDMPYCVLYKYYGISPFDDKSAIILDRFVFSWGVG
jgi:hypothetical protein